MPHEDFSFAVSPIYNIKAGIQILSFFFIARLKIVILNFYESLRKFKKIIKTVKVNEYNILRLINSQNNELSNDCHKICLKILKNVYFFYIFTNIFKLIKT